MQLGRLDTLGEESASGDVSLESNLELLTVHNRTTGRTRVTEEEAEHLKALRRIKDALSRFDLSKNEVRVYLYLARFGAQKAQRIAEALSVHRTEAYKILRRLEKQGLVSCVFERPMKFVSVPFEKALGNLIEERRQKIHMMEQWKKELMETWRSLPQPEDRKTKKETFQVLEGRRQVSVKATQLLEGCDEQLLMVLSDQNLLWLYNSPFFDDLEEQAEKRGIEVRLMTNYSPTSTYVLDEVSLGEGDFMYKEIDDTPCFFISDSEQMLLLIEKPHEADGKPYAMWTNYDTLVKSFSLLFSLIWRDPIDPSDLAELEAQA
jgi:sugar-specific transcriptional regulator TrmB